MTAVKRKILIQAGHVAPREPGIGGVGTTREQEFALAMQRALAALFAKDDRFEAVLTPGDIPDGIQVDAALFLHGDGSANRSVSGYCFGYPNHFTNQKLADLIAAEFNQIPGHPPHRRDNYTRDLAGYYGYRKVNTFGPEVLVEHGFLTNPAEQLWLFANISKLALAEYRAICKFFGLVPFDGEQNAKRRRTLRNWILARRREGRSWAWIKSGPNWREFIRRGGR